ncbi:MAG: carbon-nitrogen hydrolase family protein [Saprospiraceae bacterium]|nr:carbon-nitrogen hydrolase family protein [Saprospiraceae bacterium]
MDPSFCIYRCATGARYFLRFFCALAARLKIWLCLGLTEKTDTCFYNTALLIDDSGKIVHRYRKINLLEVEHPYYQTGTQLGVVHTPFGIIGVNICADNYIESLHIGKTLSHMGAQLIMSPSSWTVDHFVNEEMDPYKDKWIKPLSTLATLYEIPVVSTTSVGYIVGGPYEGKKMIGCSLAIDKHGQVTQGEFNEFAGDLKVVELEMGEANRKGTQFGTMLRAKGQIF